MINDIKDNKQKILEIIGENAPLPSKKIYLILQDKIHIKVTYQGVHKLLKTLLQQGKIIKKENEYSLSNLYINDLFTLIDKIKNNNKNQISGNINYLKFKLKYIGVRFIPFYLGKIKSLNLNIIYKDNFKIIFLFENSLISYFPTSGIAILIFKEKETSSNVIELLSIRRKCHISTINKKSKITDLLKRLSKSLNLNSEMLLDSIIYVYAIYFIKKGNYFPEYEDLMKIICLPSISGINDNPKISIGPNYLEKVKKEFSNHEKIQTRKNLIQISVNTDTIYVSWSNIIYSVKKFPEDLTIIDLIQLEIELQYLWYSFYLLCNTNRFINPNRDLIQHYLSIWNNITKINATDDLKTIRLKESLILTSRINKIYEGFTQKYSKWIRKH